MHSSRIKSRENFYHGFVYSGYTGYSDPGFFPRTSSRNVEWLTELLEAEIIVERLTQGDSWFVRREGEWNLYFLTNDPVSGQKGLHESH
jgi:hypothetical protein